MAFTVIMLYLFLYLFIEYDHSSPRSPLSTTIVSPQMTSTIKLAQRPELCGPFSNPSSLQETHCAEPNSVHKHVVLSRQQVHVVCMHHMPSHWGLATVKASFFWSFIFCYYYYYFYSMQLRNLPGRYLNTIEIFDFFFFSCLPSLSPLPTFSLENGAVLHNYPTPNSPHTAHPLRPRAAHPPTTYGKTACNGLPNDMVLKGPLLHTS